MGGSCAGRGVPVGRGWSDSRIAQALRSPVMAERHRGVGAFIRRFTFPAPAQLALAAADASGNGWQYSERQPLAEQLLECAELPEPVRTAWRVALLEGDELDKALQELNSRHGQTLRRCISGYGAWGEDAYQEFMLRIVRDRQFRRKCFGSYAGEGELSSYLMTVMRQTAAMTVPHPDAESADMEDVAAGESAAEKRVKSDELRRSVKETLKEVGEDLGLVPFLLQQCLGMTQEDTAEILGTKGNSIRQRTFRFRQRFQRTWRRLNQGTQGPFMGPEGD